LFETQKSIFRIILGTEFDLSKATTFYYCNRNFDTRFAIRYTSKTLGIEEVAATEDGIYISNKKQADKSYFY
jgi:hypothetical protein